MGLTRGSRTEIEHGPIRFNSVSMKEWGKRHFSNDWTHRFKGMTSVVTGESSSRNEEGSKSQEFVRPEGPLSSKPPPLPQNPSHAHGCTSLLVTTLISWFTFSDLFFF